MKIFPILLITFLLISCAQSPSSKNTDLSIPVVEIPRIANRTPESNPSLPALPDKIVAVIPVKVPAFPTPESMEDLSRKEKLNRLRKFGLSDLEKQQTEKDDLEIRVWQINDLYMRLYKDLAVRESVFILKLTNGNWSAKVFRNTVKDKSNVEKQIRINLGVPKSGWKNVWQNLVDNELLTFPDSVRGEVESATHTGSLITESKVNGIFKTFLRAGNYDVREIRHIARILNIIADEFGLEDFQATRQFE